MEIIKIWRITFQLLNRSTNKPTPAESMDSDRLKIVIQYMKQHYSEKITLEDIAVQLSLSRSECCRFFKDSENNTKKISGSLIEDPE